MVPNVDGTQWHKIKTRNKQRHRTQCVYRLQTKQKPMYNSLPKYLRDVFQLERRVLKKC